MYVAVIEPLAVAGCDIRTTDPTCEIIRVPAGIPAPATTDPIEIFVLELTPVISVLFIVVVPVNCPLLYVMSYAMASSI